MMKFINYYIILIMNLTILNTMIMMFPSFYKKFHPILMTSLLMVFSILSSMSLSIFYSNSWMSYIMFLVMIGGMMIIFLYFNSFINNMIMSMKFNFITYFNFKLMITSISILFLTLSMFKFLIWFNNFNEINYLNYYYIMNKMNKNLILTLSYIYNKNLSLMITIMYLLIMLTIIVKIIMMNKFMLRKIN
uniref:NADH dehydrogenase subunit 6 n=1 Tax=Anagyrus jenniferae TaxID=2058195 RepID=UPI002E78440A|nr:NADH dehydrogenase subunit 6 [Anagyrus jenniferae]WPT46951.1 NADH dehydrogenase subunit 6 [Anagyrus jenniferae]